MLGSTTDDDDGPQRAFTVVQQRRTGRRRCRLSDTQRPQETAPQNPSESQRQRRQQHQRQQRRGTLLVGKANVGSFFSAARKLREKTVLCVDNVDTACTVERMSNFISSLSVKVLSIFEVKPRRRYYEDEDDVKEKKAFGVCIYANELDRLLNAETWPNAVSVSTWYSKSRTADNVDSKKIRMASGRVANCNSDDSSVQSVSALQANNCGSLSSSAPPTVPATVFDVVSDEVSGGNTELKTQSPVVVVADNHRRR